MIGKHSCEVEGQGWRFDGEAMQLPGLRGGGVNPHHRTPKISSTTFLKPRTATRRLLSAILFSLTEKLSWLHGNIKPTSSASDNVKTIIIIATGAEADSSEWCGAAATLLKYFAVERDCVIHAALLYSA